MATPSTDYEAWKKVLHKYCSRDIQEAFRSLSNDGKTKLLEALKALVAKHNMGSFSKRGMLERLMSNIDSEMMRFAGNFAEVLERNGQENEPILYAAIKSTGAKFMVDYFEFDGLKDELQKWGDVKSISDVVTNQNEKIAHLKQMGSYQTDQKSVFGNETSVVFTDLTSEAGVKKEEGKMKVDFSKLEKTFIKNLKLFETAKGKYIEGVLLTNPQIMVGLTTVLQDDHGDVVQLAVYNVISSSSHMKWELAEQMFPKGAHVKISEPFYKIFLDSNRGIRVDSPAEITTCTSSVQNVDEIRRLGRDLVKSKDYLQALSLYIKGLQSFHVVATLLNNRAQAEIKLGLYEEALLDASAVFLFMDNEKAKERYEVALKKLGLSSRRDKENVRDVWKKLLSYRREVFTVEECLGSKEEGNDAYKKGNYQLAREHYTAAIQDSGVSTLLNNIGVVCVKLRIFQTSIAAASACLQVSTKPDERRKARFTMSKAFSDIGELEFSKLSANGDISLKSFWNTKRDVHAVIKKLEARMYFIVKVDHAIKTIENETIPCDYVRSDLFRHEYAPGKGRGLVATQAIPAKTILLVDHPVYCEGMDITKMQMTVVTNCSSQEMHGQGHTDLVTKLLSLVIFDGLLAKKLLLLEHRSEVGENDQCLPLVNDLQWMSYLSLSKDVLPFLPQTPSVVGCDLSCLTEAFISKMVNINTFSWGIESETVRSGSGLMLLLSLLNHDHKPNAIRFPVDGNAMIVQAVRDIDMGEELTITYGVSESTLQKKWGIL